MVQVRTRRRKKLNRPRVPMLLSDQVNKRWSMDFVSDQLANGRRFRVLNVVDDFSRECMLQVADFSISGQRLALEPDRLSGRRPLLNTIVCDSGLELASKAIFFRSRQSGVKLHFIQPGKRPGMPLLRASMASSGSTDWILSLIHISEPTRLQ